MKNFIPLALAVLFAGCFSTANAQYVTIPDATFVSWLNSNGFASCMNGSQLDTTCSAVTSATTMSCSAVPIRNLSGIQYFKNLTSLDCSNDSLYTLPALPSLLTNFNCQYNNLSTLPILPSGLTWLQCYNNQLTALPALPASLNYLDCHQNQLTSLPALSATLQYFYCDNNGITSLPSLPANLSQLSCSYNQLTFLPALPATLQGLDCDSNHLTTLPTLATPTLLQLECQYNQLTTLPVLPTGLQQLQCGNNYLNSLPALPGTLDLLDCRYNQISALPTLPANLQSIYCHYNRLNTLPALPAGLQLLQCDSNQLTAIPTLPAGLTFLSLPYNNVTSIPILPTGVVWLDCSYNPNLTLVPELPDSLQLLNCDNDPNLTCLPELKRILYFSWSGTAITCLPDYGSITNSSPDLSTVPLCGIFNSTGCQAFWNISGQCYYDQNSDCQFDSIDLGTNYVKTMLYSGSNLVQQTYSGGEGYYSFDSVPYGNYGVHVDISNLPFTISCPGMTGYSVNLSSSDTLSFGNDFAFACITSGFDVGVQSVLNGYVTPRPNATFTLSTVAGDMSELYGAHCASGTGGSVQIAYTGPITYTGPAAGALTPTTVSGGTVTWNIADYGAVNDFTAFNLLFQIDSLATPGTSVCFTVTVTPAAGDYNPSNNTLTYCFPVVASLDPNEKEVYPAGNIDASNWLTYTLRFQNTGSATAINIKVADTLSSNLDPSTFQLLTYSAKNLTQIFGNVVVFNFPNINLPDSASAGDSASRGFVQFRIKPMEHVSIGSQIDNTAYVYFDQNTAIVTNTTVNTVTSSGIIPLPQGDGLALRIYPNPANNIIYIQDEGIQAQTTSIYNVNGQLIYTGRYSPQLDVTALTPGVYFVEVNAPGGTARKVFVKM